MIVTKGYGATTLITQGYGAASVPMEETPFPIWINLTKSTEYDIALLEEGGGKV